MPNHRRRSWLSMLTLIGAVMASACSVNKLRVQTELARVDDRELDQRTQLGHLGAYGELSDGQQRGREAAELALELGNTDEASSFARQQLELARAQVLIARIQASDEAALDDALAQLDDAARFAVEIGDRVLDSRLVVEAAQFMRAPKQVRRPLVRALATVREADLSWGYDQLWSALGNDASALAALQRLRWRSHRSPGLPFGSQRLSPTSLAAAGSVGVDLLWIEADRAATERRREDLSRWIDAILEADRWDVDAQAIRVVLDALDTDKLDYDVALLPDLSSSTADPLGAQARMLIRHAAAPDSLALALWRANDMIVQGTFGDAGELLAKQPGAPASETEQALLAALEAKLALESGSEFGRREFESWRRKTKATRSPSLNAYVSDFEQDSAPEGHVALAREADRRLVSEDHGRNAPRLTLPVLGSAAIDGKSNKRARTRALAGIAGRDPELGARLAICRERKLVDDDCRDMLDELTRLDDSDEDYPAGLDALAGSANTRAEWFSSIPFLEGESLAAVRERLLEYEGTRVAATTDFQTAALFSELAANRPDLARARLQRVSSLLRPETRAIATMALRDLDDGLVEPRALPNLLVEIPSADIEAAWFEERWLPGDAAAVNEAYPGRSRLARFGRGLALARMGAWQSSAAELLLTVDELEGQAKGVVAGRLAMVATLAGQTQIRDRALAIAEAEDPLGFMAPYVRARVAEDALDRDDAHALYLTALSRRPRALAALEGALRTLDIRKRELERVRDVLLLFPDPNMHWAVSELLDAAARDELDGHLLTNLWLARNDGATLLAIGEPSAKIPALAERALDRLLDELRSAPTPADAFPLAAKVLAWLSAGPPQLRIEYRNLELWLTYLISRDSDLEALIRAQPRDQGYFEPSPMTHPTVLLAEARRRRAVDDLLGWAIVRDELWDDDDPTIRMLLSDLYGKIDDPALAQYACLRMFRRDEFEIAAERCVPLWRELDGSPFMAVDFAYLALNDPDLLRANGLDLGEFFARAEQLPLLDQDPVWLLNASLWWSRQGDHARGADLRLRQLALDSIAQEPDALELGQARHRGALLRQQIINQFGRTDRRALGYAAGSALRSLDLIAAELYANRLLAWVPVDADLSTAEFTARSPDWLAATRVEGETSDAELRSTAYYVLSMVALVQEDLALERIDRTGMLTLLDHYAEDRGLAEYERVAADHADSHVAKLILLSAYAEAGMREQATAIARELIEAHGDDPLVLAEALPLLTNPDDLDAARELLVFGRALYPDHPWLSDEQLPAILTGAEDALPSWLRNPEAFDAQLATLGPAELDALAPTRRSNDKTAAEAFFAAATESNSEGLGARQEIPGAEPLDEDGSLPQRVQFVFREPRASRCEGMGCAEPQIAEWVGRNYALLWSRELELPSGKAIEFVVADDEIVIDNVLIPSGGNLFVLVSATAPDDFGAFMPNVALLRESFRPLDWVLGAATAEGLRGFGRGMPEDRVRLAARRAQAKHDPTAGDPCPLAGDPSLMALPTDARGELLLDLYLGSRSAEQRRALLTCTKPDAPEAARLALVALLDVDATAFEFGRAATQVHHERVLTDTRRVLYQEREAVTSDPSLTVSGEQPPFGLLQVIAALPDEHGRALTKELLSRRDPRLRALALAASATMDYFGPFGEPNGRLPRTEVERLREVVEAGEAKDALLASRSLMEIPGPENLAVLRARADKLIRDGIADEQSRGLAIELGWGLIRNLDGKDRKRLDELAKAVSLTPTDKLENRAQNVKQALEDMAEDFAKARARASKSAPANNHELEEIIVRNRRARPKPRDAKAIAAASLAELTPGNEWTFVRVGDAGLFATSLEGLLRRLAPANPADAYLVRALIHDTLLQGSFSLLGESGGLDLSAPIECVSPKGSESFACSAKVSDRNAVLSTLANRELGDDAGVAVPLSLATEFAGLPMMLGSMPVSLHSLVESPDEDFDANPAAEIAAERLRMKRTIAGHELEYYATVELHENRLVVDSEHYMFLGDRLLVFSGVDIAEQLLREAPSGSKPLANAPHFAEAVGRWRDGVALQAVDLTGDLGMPEVALEVVFDNEGIEFTARTRGDRRALGDFGDLWRLLPSEPVSAVAMALEPDGLRESFEDAELERCKSAVRAAAATEAAEPDAKPDAKPVAKPDAKPGDKPGKPEPKCGLAATDHLPPIELAEQASAVLLGWYPEVGQTLWQSWTLVMPLDNKLRKAVAKAKLQLPNDKQIVAQDNLHWTVREDALIIASSEVLAQAALAQPLRRAGAPTPSTFARVVLDGQRGAQVIRELVPGSDRRGEFMRVIATMIGLVDHVELRADWAEGDEGQVRARVLLNLAESEEELALINRWLASGEVGNASKLPRRLASSETDRGLAYRIKVDDAEQFARTAIPSDNPRISVEVLAPDELRMTVLPSRAVPSSASKLLPADERERMLAPDSLARSEDPQIRKIAKDLRVAGNDPATVEAVVAWVHQKVRYEITPTSLDAVQILDRGTGDCTEYALLTVTLLRAAGIPAKLQEGMSAGGEEMVAHAWVAWHDGQRWHEVDPTAGTNSVGSGHLELEIVDVLAMISLGRFEVVAIDPLP